MILLVIGILSVVGGGLCFMAGFADASATQFAIGVPAITIGFVLIGFSSGIGLLTRIANYLARIATRLEATKADSDKRTEAIRKKLEPPPVVQSKPTEPGIYKL